VKLLLIPNHRVDKAEDIARKVLEAIGQEHEVRCTPNFAESMGLPAPEGGEDFDAMITVGGDGTILWALQQYDFPVIGVNIGKVGFMAEVRPDDIDAAVARVLAGDYTVEERTRLKVVLNDERLPDCLNELVVYTADIAKLRDYWIDIEGFGTIEVRADAVIVATATGSTSYSLSAGGPILHPKVAGFVIQSLAPFKLNNRPIVVPPTSTIRIRLTRRKTCKLVLDGQMEKVVTEEDVITCTHSERPARFIRLDPEFHTRVAERLNL